MIPWGWRPARQEGIWKYGAAWMRPLLASSPYLSVLTCLLMLHFLSGKMVSSRGVVLELPDSRLGEGELTEMVALVTPMSSDTMVFFDDSRYMVSDPRWESVLGEHISERATRSEFKTLLVLADRRVTADVLMNLAAIAKRGGIDKVVFAERRVEVRE